MASHICIWMHQSLTFLSGKYENNIRSYVVLQWYSVDVRKGNVITTFYNNEYGYLFLLILCFLVRADNSWKLKCCFSSCRANLK